jgi:hypothetical protein
VIWETGKTIGVHLLTNYKWQKAMSYWSKAWDRIQI